MESFKDHLKIVPKVTILNTLTKLDLPATRILEAAIEEELESVLVVGWTKEKEIYTASSLADGGDILWLIEKFKQRLLNL